MTTHLFPRAALFLFVSSLTLVGLQAADFLADISSAQQAQVKAGEQVLLTEDVDGNVWPRIRVYRTIDATPEQVAAVFCDYNNAKSFVPNLLKSEISQKISPSVVEVDYILDIPILPDEYYTIRNTVKKVGADGYRVDWKLIRAAQTKATVGSIQIEPYGNGQSLICYQNLVTPGSGMAMLLRGKAIDQMRQTVVALAAQVEKQKKSDPAGLDKEIKALQAALD